MTRSTPIPAITPRRILDVMENPFVSFCISDTAFSVCSPTGVSSVTSSCTGASVGAGVGSASIT